MFWLSDKVFQIGWSDRYGSNLPALSEWFEGHVIDLERQARGIANRDLDRVFRGELASRAGFQNFTGNDGVSV